jgi:hypothetical protein
MINFYIQATFSAGINAFGYSIEGTRENLQSYLDIQSSAQQQLLVQGCSSSIGSFLKDQYNELISKFEIGFHQKELRQNKVEDFLREAQFTDIDDFKTGLADLIALQIRHSGRFHLGEHTSIYQVDITDQLSELNKAFNTETTGNRESQILNLMGTTFATQTLVGIPPGLVPRLRSAIDKIPDVSTGYLTSFWSALGGQKEPKKMEIVKEISIKLEKDVIRIREVENDMFDSLMEIETQMIHDLLNLELKGHLSSTEAVKSVLSEAEWRLGQIKMNAVLYYGRFMQTSLSRIKSEQELCITRLRDVAAQRIRLQAGNGGDVLNEMYTLYNQFHHEVNNEFGCDRQLTREEKEKLIAKKEELKRAILETHVDQSDANIVIERLAKSIKEQDEARILNEAHHMLTEATTTSDRLVLLEDIRALQAGYEELLMSNLRHLNDFLSKLESIGKDRLKKSFRVAHEFIRDRIMDKYKKLRGHTWILEKKLTPDYARLITALGLFEIKETHGISHITGGPVVKYDAILFP